MNKKPIVVAVVTGVIAGQITKSLEDQVPLVAVDFPLGAAVLTSSTTSSYSAAVGYDALMDALIRLDPLPKATKHST
jgi:hypothetical protein